jgi:APA family basic amino acid/polyamine antiporter
VIPIEVHSCELDRLARQNLVFDCGVSGIAVSLRCERACNRPFHEKTVGMISMAHWSFNHHLSQASITMKDLFAKKPLSEVLREVQHEDDSSTPSLKRQLGPVHLILLGIGVVIGAGLFSLTGKVAAEAAGPAVTLSYIIGGIACALAGLCYAEFASMVPASGSAYTYSYVTLGQFFAWIIGWDLVLEYAVGAATVATAWSAYFIKLCQQLGIHFPQALAASPFDDNPGIVNLPAAFIILAMTALLIKGTKESVRFNAVMVVLKVIIVLTVVGLGWAYINPANHTPFIPANTGTFGEFGWSGIMRGAGLIFFAYIGFDAVSTAAQEARNPQRDMPIGILGSLFICTVLYIAFSWVLTGLASYTTFKGLDKLAPVATAISAMPQGFHWLNQLIVPAILCGFSSVIMVLLMGQSRVFFTMSRDGLLPSFFSDLHPKLRTPWKSNGSIGIVAALAVAILPGDLWGEMCSIGTLLAFVLVCIAVIVLRIKEPNAPRVFRCPAVPLVPILGALVCISMMVPLPGDTWIRLVVWMAIGFIIYFGYSRKHSRLNGENSQKN